MALAYLSRIFASEPCALLPDKSIGEDIAWENASQGPVRFSVPQVDDTEHADSVPETQAREEATPEDHILINRLMTCLFAISNARAQTIDEMAAETINSKLEFFRETWNECMNRCYELSEPDIEKLRVIRHEYANLVNGRRSDNKTKPYIDAPLDFISDIPVLGLH